jgi:hypothetical protein
MTAQLIALAMNPNLTEREFLDLSERVMENKIRMIETATECMGKLPKEQRVEYALAVLPLLLTL